MMPQAQTAASEAPAHARTGAGRLGMWIFLGTELMLFGPLFLGYVYGRSHFAPAFAAASRHTDFWLGTANTAVLLTSSAVMALAVATQERHAPRRAAGQLAFAALCGVLFLALKLVEYRHDFGAHLFPGPGFRFAPMLAGGAELFFFLYFAMTALHALHLAIGIGVTLVFAVGLRAGVPALLPPARLELVGLYWHFVDTVWLFLYPILYLVGRSGASG